MTSPACSLRRVTGSGHCITHAVTLHVTAAGTGIPTRFKPQKPSVKASKRVYNRTMPTVNDRNESPAKNVVIKVDHDPQVGYFASAELQVPGMPFMVVTGKWMDTAPSAIAVLEKRLRRKVTAMTRQAVKLQQRANSLLSTCDEVRDRIAGAASSPPIQRARK